MEANASSAVTESQRSDKPRRRLSHIAAGRTYRWMMRRGMVRKTPGEFFNITHHTIRLRRIPEALNGLRICHLSDLHMGQFLRPKHLPRIVDAANAIGAELIAVTGDLIDHTNEHLDTLVDAMAQLSAPLGAYFVLGNHDYRDDVEQIIRAFDRRGLPLLINQAVQVTCRGHRIAIGGIDYANEDHVLNQYVKQTVALMPTGDLRILLAHHPHAFDAARRSAVHLTLSGHTHGGQLLLRRQRGSRQSVGLGNLAWRYPQGQYHVRGSALHVSNGLGSAFPIRLRCPAEMNELTIEAI